MRGDSVSGARHTAVSGLTFALGSTCAFFTSGSYGVYGEIPLATCKHIRYHANKHSIALTPSSSLTSLTPLQRLSFPSHLHVSHISLVPLSSFLIFVMMHNMRLLMAIPPGSAEHRKTTCSLADNTAHPHRARMLNMSAGPFECYESTSRSLRFGNCAARSLVRLHTVRGSTRKRSTMDTGTGLVAGVIRSTYASSRSGSSAAPAAAAP